MRHAVLLVFSLAIAVINGLQFTSTKDAEAAPRYEVGVWYPGWGNAGISDYNSLSTNASSVGRVMPYWYALKADGSVYPYEWAEDSKLVSLVRDKGIRLMPLVTNEFDPARANKMLSNQASRDVHATELTKLAVSKGYDGLDLDYESMHAADRENFSLFVEDLASRLHAEGKKLSVAVHPKTSEPGSWDGPKAQDWRRIGQAADEFEIMIYDYHWDGSEAGPAAPQEWIESVLTFAEKEVDPAKIRMGLPFYGRDWVETKAKDLVYDEAQALISQHNATVQRSPSGEPYFTYRDTGGVEHTVYFQDSKSLIAKLDVLTLKHPNVGGISVWHIGGESPEHWTTVNNELDQQPTPTNIDTDPDNGATGVPRDTKPTVTFDRLLFDDPTVIRENVKLQVYNKKKKRWVTVSSTPTYDNKVITVTPANTLGSQKKYRVLLKTGIKSWSGDALEKTYSFMFITGSS